MRCNKPQQASPAALCNDVMQKAWPLCFNVAEEFGCVTDHVDPDGAFSKEAQTAAAEEQVSGMSTGGSIKVHYSLPRDACKVYITLRYAFV